MSDDDLTVDFTGSETYGGGFDPLPRNWYRVVVSDWEPSEVKNEGKFPAGTPGTNWELTVEEGDYENRKLWINHWHHPTSLPFLKGFLLATGKFAESELSGPVNINEARERALGASLMAKAVIRPAKGDFDARNDVKSVRAIGDVPDEGGGQQSLLP